MQHFSMPSASKKPIVMSGSHGELLSSSRSCSHTVGGGGNALYKARQGIIWQSGKNTVFGLTFEHDMYMAYNVLWQLQLSTKTHVKHPIGIHKPQTNVKCPIGTNTKKAMLSFQQGLHPKNQYKASSRDQHPSERMGG